MYHSIPVSMIAQSISFSFDLQRSLSARPFAFLLISVSLILSSCADSSDMPEGSEPITAQHIVDKAIDVYGGDILENARVTFDFRGREFVMTRNSGVFSYERIYTDSTGANIHEIISNDGFTRLTNGEQIDTDEDLLARMERSVNAVVYFTRLPTQLNDGAVIKRYLGESDIEGEKYHEIEVTFEQEGGGRDYQDRFIYWFHAERYTMDYMAYYYYTDEQGSRFRKAVNAREIGGVKFQDYLNYSAPGINFDNVEDYETLFNEGKVELVSEINNENIVVEPLVAN